MVRYCTETIKETGRHRQTQNECKFSPTEVVSRHSVSDAYCQFCYTRTPPLSHLSFPPWIPSFIYLFICPSFIPVMLSFTRLLSRPPPLSPSSSSSLLSRPLPHSTPPFSAWIPLFHRPSLLPFIHHRSLPPALTPAIPLTLPLLMRGVMEIGWETRRGRKLQVWVETWRGRWGERRPGKDGAKEWRENRGENGTDNSKTARERLRQTVQICNLRHWHS